MKNITAARKRKYAEPLSSESITNFLYLIIGYRLKAHISEVMMLSDGGYYICPRCKVTLERDFQDYCDRCGQHLDWTECRKAKVIYPGIRLK